MSTESNRQLRFAREPSGFVDDTTFELVEVPIDPPRAGEVRVRNLLLSIDPTMRVWLDPHATYLDEVHTGDVFRAIAIAVVEASTDPDLPPGTLVQGLTGCQAHAVVPAAQLTPLPAIPGLPLDAHFGLLGHIGTTAYCGLVEIGRVRSGETLVVSAAAGAVGSLAAQIGLILGCRVIGIAGSADKCRYLTDTLGLHGAIDYRSEDVDRALARLCPDGVDVYFDNVGGRVLEAVLEHMKDFGRIVGCGMISGYNDGKVECPDNLLYIVTKRLRFEGFVILDERHDKVAAYEHLLQWAAEGRLRYRIHRFEGLASVPTAINTLFDGSNHGKVVVQLAPEPQPARD